MIKRYLLKWAGKISVRSGTARLAFVPEWDDDLPAVDNLSFFPGSQIMIVVPAQSGAPAPERKAQSAKRKEEDTRVIERSPSAPLLCALLFALCSCGDPNGPDDSAARCPPRRDPAAGARPGDPSHRRGDPLPHPAGHGRDTASDRAARFRRCRPARFLLRRRSRGQAAPRHGGGPLPGALGPRRFPGRRGGRGAGAAGPRRGRGAARAAGPVLLGAVSQECKTAFTAVLEGGGDSDRLAARLAWTPERAADALQTLALRRLVVAAHGTFSPLPLQ